MVPEADSQSAKTGTCRHKLTAGVRGSVPKHLRVSVQYGAAQSARIGLGCESQRGTSVVLVSVASSSVGGSVHCSRF
jgi:hypothetical protein